MFKDIFILLFFLDINVLVNESDDDDDDGDEELQRYLALHASKNITPGM